MSPRSEHVIVQRSIIRVLETSVSPSGRGLVKVEELSSPMKPITPGRREQLMRRGYRPLALKVGWIAFEWNRLQEGLCELFADVLGMREVAFAIWHSTPNDRTQRDMLRAALMAYETAEPPELRLRDDAIWVLDHLNSLAGRRNNAIHAPLVFTNHATDGGFEVHMEVQDDTGNPRALGLSGKPLLEEFEWYRDHLSRLAQFVEHLHWTKLFDDFPWPDRPRLPSRGQYRSRASARRKGSSK